MSHVDFIRPATLRFWLLTQLLPADAITIFAGLLEAFATLADLLRDALATFTGLLAGAPSILADLMADVFPAFTGVLPEALPILELLPDALATLTEGPVELAILGEPPLDALTLTRAVPEPSMPRTDAAALETSMIRPATQGPRSLITRPRAPLVRLHQHLAPKGNGDVPRSAPGSSRRSPCENAARTMIHARSGRPEPTRAAEGQRLWCPWQRC
jgi:hypothetical protein